MGFVTAFSNCRDWFKHSGRAVPITGRSYIVHFPIMDSFRRVEQTNESDPLGPYCIRPIAKIIV